MLLILGLPLRAQEVSVQGGNDLDLHSNEVSYVWQINFQRPVARGVELSFGWLNEGHFAGHHRDGFIGQLWIELARPRERFSLWGGAGIYQYFDTITDGTDGFRNDHGLRPVLGLQGRYRPEGSRWEILATLYGVATGPEPHTIGVAAGLSYHPQRGAPKIRLPGPLTLPAEYRSVLVYSGTAILNSFHSQTSRAFAAEYRNAFWPHGAWSVSYTNEGDMVQLRRHGLAAQLWLTESFFGRRLELELGGGPYFAHANMTGTGGDSRAFWSMNTRVSLGVGLRINEDWSARLHWHRTLTSYSRDTDALLLGLGYSW